MEKSQFKWKDIPQILAFIISCVLSGLGVYAIYVIFASDPTNINSIFADCILPAISIFVTGVLSYLIWRANKTSAELSVRLAELEMQRDISSIRDNATALYFSLLSCLDSLVFNYAQKDTTRTLYCNKKWIDNLSALSEYLTEEETYWLFNFFKDTDQFNQSNEAIAEICKSTFDHSVLEYIISYHPKERVMAKKALWLLPYHVLTKLDTLRTAETEIEAQVVRDLSITNKRVEQYKNGKLFFEIEYQDETVKHKKIFDGRSNDIIEDCKYENGLPTGKKATYHNGKKVEEGTYMLGKLMDGKKYHVHLDNNYELPDEGPEEDYDNYPEYYDRYMKVVVVKDGKAIMDTSPSNIELEYQE